MCAGICIVQAQACAQVIDVCTDVNMCTEMHACMFACVHVCMYAHPYLKGRHPEELLSCRVRRLRPHDRGGAGRDEPVGAEEDAEEGGFQLGRGGQLHSVAARPTNAATMSAATGTKASNVAQRTAIIRELEATKGVRSVQLQPFKIDSTSTAS